MFGMHRIGFRQIHMTTQLQTPSERLWMKRSCRRKQSDVCVLSCTTMPFPDDERINITFTRAVEKYKCLYDKSPQSNNNFPRQNYESILFERKKIPYKHIQGTSSMLCVEFCVRVISCSNPSGIRPILTLMHPKERAGGIGTRLPHIIPSSDRQMIVASLLRTTIMSSSSNDVIL